MPDPELAIALERARGRPDPSTLFGYIYDNFELISVQHANGDSWSVIRAAMIARGIVDANGREPSISAIKSSYQRVQRAKTKQQRPQIGRPRAEPASQPVGQKHSSKIFG